MDAVFVHDPCALAAVLRPDLFVWQPGQVSLPIIGILKFQMEIVSSVRLYAQLCKSTTKARMHGLSQKLWTDAAHPERCSCLLKSVEKLSLFDFDV